MHLRGFLLPLMALGILLALWDSERITAPRAEPGRVRVTYWEKWNDFEYDAMKAVVDEFNHSQNRIQVDLLSISGVGEKTLMAIAGGEPPDIAGLWGENVAQYADDHAVLSLDDYCKQYGIDRSRYVPVYWDMCVYHGHVYALPSAPHSTALHYNRTLFTQAGLDPDHPPKTIEAMDAMAERITKRDARGHIDIAGFIPAEPGWWNWGWGFVFGGRLWDGKAKLTANAPENIRAFEWIRSYSLKYGASELQTFRSGFGNDLTPQNAFISGKDAMELQGVWMHNYIQQSNPSLKWSASPFPYPADRPDLANLNFANQDVFVIPRGARHPAEAFAFLNFVQSQHGMELLCMGQKKHTPLRNVSAAFWRNHPNPYIHMFEDLAWSKNNAVPPPLGIWPEYKNELSNAFDEVALLKKTPKQALDYVQARMQPKLDEHLDRLRRRGEIP